MAVDTSSAEQTLRDVVRRHRRSSKATKALEAERDEAIRQALRAGMTYPQAGEIAGLSRQRVDQIRRRANL